MGTQAVVTAHATPVHAVAQAPVAVSHAVAAPVAVAGAAAYAAPVGAAYNAGCASSSPPDLLTTNICFMSPVISFCSERAHCPKISGFSHADPRQGPGGNLWNSCLGCTIFTIYLLKLCITY